MTSLGPIRGSRIQSAHADVPLTKDAIVADDAALERVEECRDRRLARSAVIQFDDQYEPNFEAVPLNLIVR
jgi:hypothetical protein